MTDILVAMPETLKQKKTQSVYSIRVGKESAYYQSIGRGLNVKESTDYLC